VRAVVCGPKGAGKSTLVRLLVNTLQAATRASVGLLDADCGAPEVTPPGLVSLSLLARPLLGPPAARLGGSDAPLPLETRFIGDTSPSADPGAYAGALAALLATWHAQPAPQPHQGAQPAPLVVNTLGWVRGLGLELLCGLLRSAAPTHVIQLRPPGGGGPGGMPRGVFWAPSPVMMQQRAPGDAMAPCRVIELCAPAAGGDGSGGGGVLDDAPREPPDASASQAPQRRSAADARALLWVAWAHTACRDDVDAHAAAADARWAALLSPDGAGEAAAFSTVASALSAARPFSVPVGSLRVLALHASVAPHDALRLLNGALVALLPRDVDTDAEASAMQQRPSAPLISAAAPRCLGVALVRSVDATAGVLYLLTPVSAAHAAATVALAVGKLELPPALLSAPLQSAPYVTPWALPPDGSGGAAMRSRNNLLRGGA
jgi:hypothetical protein